MTEFVGNPGRRVGGGRARIGLALATLGAVALVAGCSEERLRSPGDTSSSGDTKRQQATGTAVGRDVGGGGMMGTGGPRPTGGGNY